MTSQVGVARRTTLDGVVRGGVRWRDERNEFSGNQVAFRVDREVTALEIVESSIVYLHHSSHRANDTAMGDHQHEVCGLGGLSNGLHHIAQRPCRSRKYEVG